MILAKYQYSTSIDLHNDVFTYYYTSLVQLKIVGLSQVLSEILNKRLRNYELKSFSFRNKRLQLVNDFLSRFST